MTEKQPSNQPPSPDEVTLSVSDHCRQQGISVEELIERTNLDPMRVKAIFMGRWTPSPSDRIQIAAALELAIDEIAWGHKTPIQHIYGHGPG